MHLIRLHTVCDISTRSRARSNSKPARSLHDVDVDVMTKVQLDVEMGDHRTVRVHGVHLIRLVHDRLLVQRDGRGTRNH